MANEPLHITFDDGFGSIASAWNVDASVPGEVRLAGNSAMMQYASGREAGQGYGTYTIEAKLEGNEPGAGIIFWPGDNQWPGQELDLAEITPDGSGRVYGTVHWNQNGNDAYEAQVYDGIYTGSWHAYQMVWEPGRITYKVDGVEKAVFTDNVPADFANGGMNNTIGFLNNNPNTSITVRDVQYQPLGGEAPAQPSPPPVEAAPEIVVPDLSEAPTESAPPPVEPAPEIVVPNVGGVVDEWVAEPAPAASSDDPWSRWTDASGAVNWDAAAAHVISNYEATGYWFV